MTEAIRDRYEAFDLSALPRLDDRLWLELADAALAVAAQGPSETAKTAYRQQVAKDIARNPEDGGGDFEDWMLDRALRAAYRVDFGPAGEDG